MTSTVDRAMLNILVINETISCSYVVASTINPHPTGGVGGGGRVVSLITARFVNLYWINLMPYGLHGIRESGRVMFSFNARNVDFLCITQMNGFTYTVYEIRT